MLINKKIKEGINRNNICVIYKKGDGSIGLVKKCVAKIARNIKDFYKFKIPEIVIELFYSREKFDEKIGHKTPEWLVGFAVKNNIYLFSPSVMEKVSNHKKSEFKKILTHEICHIFNNKINKNSLMWVNEGSALFLAGQRKKKDFTKKDLDFFYNNFFCKDIKLKTFSENKGYKISYWSIRTVVKIFNKKKLLELIKINSDTEHCKQKVEKTLKLSVEDFLEKINKKPPSPKTEREVFG